MSEATNVEDTSFLFNYGVIGVHAQGVLNVNKSSISQLNLSLLCS